MYTIPLPQNKINQHFRNRVGEAVYLLAYIIDKANWKTGMLRTTQATISQETGFPVRTIHDWLRVLQQAGELTMKRTRFGTLIQVTDFEAVARTRGYRAKDASSNRQNPADSNLQKTADKSAETCRLDMQPAAGESAETCRSNIDINLNKQKEKHVQTADLLSFSFLEKLAKDVDERCQQKPGGIFNYVADSDIKLKAALDVVLALDETQRTELAQTAMREMVQDPRGFVNRCIRVTDSGALQPAGEPIVGQVVRRMADILERRARGLPGEMQKSPEAPSSSR